MLRANKNQQQQQQQQAESLRQNHTCITIGKLTSRIWRRGNLFFHGLLCLWIPGASSLIQPLLAVARGFALRLLQLQRLSRPELRKATRNVRKREQRLVTVTGASPESRSRRKVQNRRAVLPLYSIQQSIKASVSRYPLRRASRQTTENSYRLRLIVISSVLMITDGQRDVPILLVVLQSTQIFGCY